MTDPTCHGCGEPRADCDCVPLSQFAAELRAQAPADPVRRERTCCGVHHAQDCPKAKAGWICPGIGEADRRLACGCGYRAEVLTCEASTTPPPASARWEELARTCEVYAEAVELRPDSWTSQYTADPKLARKIEQSEVAAFLRALAAQVAQVAEAERSRLAALAGALRAERDRLREACDSANQDLVEIEHRWRNDPYATGPRLAEEILATRRRLCAAIATAAGPGAHAGGGTS